MKRYAALLLLAAGAATAMGFVHPFGNPRTDARRMADPPLAHAAMPAEAKAILIQKCGDCHSEQTRWPVYARVAPGSWLIERDVIEARKHMDLSNWDKMDADDKQQTLRQIIHEVNEGEMPPPQYRLLHWDAQLTAQDKKILASLRSASSQTGGEPAGLSAHADAARGAALFNRRCTGCHSLDEAREGPPLAGVFGRKAGTAAGFDYSAGLKGSGFTWNEEKLGKWLEDPDSLVSGTKMDFSVPKAQERADLIAFLAQSKPR